MTSLLLASGESKTEALFPRALVRLCSRAQRELWGLRLTRVYGIGVGISYAVVTFGMGPEPRVAGGLWARCLTTASLVAGIGALSLARDIKARDTTQGLVGLARLRGFGEGALERARTMAGALRLTTAVAVPGLLVALAAVLKLRSLPGALQGLTLVLFTLPYAALVGGSLAVLARLSSRLLPDHGRLLFLAIVLGPWLLAMGTGATLPNLPGAFSWLIEHLAGSVR